MNLLKGFLKNLARVAIGSIVLLLLIEVGIRVVYKIRNSRVEFVPIPFMVRNFGLVPPWMLAHKRGTVSTVFGDGSESCCVDETVETVRYPGCCVHTGLKPQCE